ncbi:hypothetical protein CC78DRAFT_525075 [Lojkania enalia]|uniref:Rhodopsin domain-containing protein n=1 Tax=Lojkania enalia TaxID=147567 RepID=A0A9P4MZ92_9PLEO|nr:hypothetical protein CC78DRAFT_525075 [Didymosphaeria enalia]
MASSIAAVAIESWTLYVVGVCLISSRIIFRRITLRSFSKLQCDDWLMLFVLLPFTGTVVCANQVSMHRLSRYQDSRNAIWQLKMRFALEEFQITTTWLVKACLLILYRRIFLSTTSAKQRLFILYVCMYCMSAYIVLQILLPLWCRPVQQYWNLEPINAQCSNYHSHSIVVLALSFIATLVVLIIPVPFIPTPRKLLLVLLIALGIFVIVSGILGRYYLLLQPSHPGYIPWYVAEAASTIFFANLPFLSSLVTSSSSSRFRHVRSRLALSRWPRSTKESPPLYIERLNSDASATRSTSIREIENTWSDLKVPGATPIAPVLSLRLTDPLLELDDYWTGRPSTRSTNISSPSRRPSTIGTNQESWLRTPSIQDAESINWSRRPSTIYTELSESIKPPTRSVG